MDIGLLISKALGYGILAGSLALKVPQIMQIRKAGSVEGLSLTMFAAEAVMYGTAVCYGHVNQYPISTWGENLFILLQVYVIIGMILSYTGQTANPMYLAVGAAYVAFYGSLLAGLLPPSILATMQSLNVLVNLASRVPQILLIINTKSVGQLNITTCFLNFAGSAARVLTTMKELSDTVMLFSFSLSTLLNGILFVLFFVYPAPSGETKKEK